MNKQKYYMEVRYCPFKMALIYAVKERLFCFFSHTVAETQHHDFAETLLDNLNQINDTKSCH